MGNSQGSFEERFTIEWNAVQDRKFCLVQHVGRKSTGIKFVKQCESFLAAKADLKDYELKNEKTGFVVYKKDGQAYLVLSSTSTKDNQDWRKVTQACCEANSVAIGDKIVLGELGLLKPKQLSEDEKAPGGDWVQSARNATLQGNTLKAELLREDDTWVEAVVKVQPNTDYTNNNGVFNVSVELPKGNWIEGARNYHLKNGVLYAELRDKNQKWVKSRIEVRPGEDLMNQDGHLRPVLTRRATITQVVKGALGMEPVDPTQSSFQPIRETGHQANELQENMLALSERTRKLSKKLAEKKREKEMEKSQANTKE